MHDGGLTSQVHGAPDVAALRTVDDDRRSHPGRAAALDQLVRGLDLRTGRDPVVDEEHSLSRAEQGAQERASRLRADDHRRRLLGEQLRQSRTELGEHLSITPPSGRISADVGFGPLTDPAKALLQECLEHARSPGHRPLHDPISSFRGTARGGRAQSSIEYILDPVTFS